MEKIKITNKDAKVFLIEWKKLILESGHYPNYDGSSELPTQEFLAKIKSYLNAVYESDKNWDEVKEILKVIIDGWAKIPLKSRRVAGISSRGLPFSVEIPGCPNFAFLYDNHAAVRRLCRLHSNLNKAEVVTPKKPLIDPGEEEVDFDL